MRYAIGLALLLCACSSDNMPASASGTDGITTSSTSEGDTDPTSGTMGETSTTSDTDTGGEGLCETVFCGADLVCCAAGQECVQEACVDACDSGVRCGAQQDVCCEASQVCLGDACVDPTGDCLDSFDCELDEFCEPTLGQCLPQLDPVACEVVPEFNEVAVMEEWAWTDNEVISIPLVADLDGDGGPEVVLNLTQLDGLSWPGGAIAVLDGQTGQLEFRLDHDPAGGVFGAHGRSTVGLTDVSGDGLPDIIYAGRPDPLSQIHAVDGSGNLLWSSQDPDGTPRGFGVVNGAPSFGNFDADPEAEIVFGAAILDHDGTVVWNEGGDGAGFGTNATYTGGISAIVDLDGSGPPEIVSGRQAWSVDWGPPVTVTQFWDAGGNDGYPAIADLDLDGDPEVVLVASGEVRVLDGATGQAWCGVDPTDAMCQGDPSLRTAPVAIPGGGIGGPPTIADFDGDGRPEIAAAGGSSYTVYDLYRTGEDVVVAQGFGAPAPGDIYPRWSAATQDQSSNATGSSVFDFQGDGAAEVVYADECYMRVYDGSTGAVLEEIESSSATIHEYPLVVDVDDDGNSEILVVANDSGNNCSAIAGYTERRGLYVYGDPFDQWVGTRRVWTSHTYHVTNATSAGNAPAQEVNNWTQASLNNYRQNVQGAGAFNAPDLTVELSAQLAECIENRLTIVADVRNDGSLGAPAGIEVSLYEGMDATGTLLGTQTTPDPLLPGQQTQLVWSLDFMPGSPELSLFVAVDGQSAETGTVVECDETNNAATALSAACPLPG